MSLNFEEYCKEMMEKVVKSHQHKHPFLEQSYIVKSIIDKENKRAAFVLFEHIDTDRCTPYGEGWLGDQYRYSIWYIKGFEEPKQIYEDHAWKRKSVSALTGTSGRDPYIGLEELLGDGVIALITPEGTQNAYGDLSQVRVKIKLDGKIEEPDDFFEQAKNLVKRIGDKLGYDYLSDFKKLKNKNVAVAVWATENGSTYGYDTVYLVWKDKNGKINYEELTNSKIDKAYLIINELKEEGDKIIIEVKGKKYERSKRNLGIE